MRALFESEHCSETSFDDVVLAWLKAEKYRHERQLSTSQRVLIDTPDPRNDAEHQLRFELLREWRGGLLSGVPLATTSWYEVRYLRFEHLRELLVIPDKYWFSLESRFPRRLHEAAEHWASPILWGHKKQGPFTILEGNTRLTCAAREPCEDLKLLTYVGLSNDYCHWHLPDRLPGLI
jgi:hypothetical protein